MAKGFDPSNPMLAAIDVQDSVAIAVVTRFFFWEFSWPLMSSQAHCGKLVKVCAFCIELVEEVGEYESDEMRVFAAESCLLL